MELDTTLVVYHEELERIYKKHRFELDENEQRHRSEIKRLCAENALEIFKLKRSLRSYDLDLLTSIEKGIIRTQAEHNKIVSYLIKEIYKLKKTGGSVMDDEKQLLLDLSDANAEASDYVLLQNAIDTKTKYHENCIQEINDLHTVVRTHRQLIEQLSSFLIVQREEQNSIVKHNTNGIGHSAIFHAGDNGAINLVDGLCNLVPSIKQIVALTDKNYDFNKPKANLKELCRENSVLEQKNDSLIKQLNNEDSATSNMVDNLINEKKHLIRQLTEADNRLQSLNIFFKTQKTERKRKREHDSRIEVLKRHLRDKTKMLVNEHKEAEERYEKLKAKQQKTKEMLKVSEQEVTSLKEMICGMEQRMEIFAQNEISNKNYISSLTKMLKEKQTNQQDMLAELDRMRNLYEEQNQSSTPEFGDAEIVVNSFRLKLKDLEKSISKRIKELDQFWVVDECSSPMSEVISVAERSESQNNIRVQERLSSMYKSEDAILKHESEQRVSLKALNKQLKDLQSEVDTLRTRLAEKSNQLTAAKMKIDNLQVL